MARRAAARRAARRAFSARLYTAAIDEPAIGPSCHEKAPISVVFLSSAADALVAVSLPSSPATSASATGNGSSPRMLELVAAAVASPSSSSAVSLSRFCMSAFGASAPSCHEKEPTCATAFVSLTSFVSFTAVVAFAAATCVALVALPRLWRSAFGASAPSCHENEPTCATTFVSFAVVVSFVVVVAFVVVCVALVAFSRRWRSAFGASAPSCHEKEPTCATALVSFTDVSFAALALEALSAARRSAASICGT